MLLLLRLISKKLNDYKCLQYSIFRWWRTKEPKKRSVPKPNGVYSAENSIQRTKIKWKCWLMEKFSNDLLILCWWDGLERKNISTRKSGKSIKFIKRWCSCYESKKCTLISVFLVIQFFLCCYFCFELLLPLLRCCCCYYYYWCFKKKKMLWCWFFVAVVTAALIWYRCWNQCLIH